MYFVDKCEAMISTERLKISKCFESSAYLQLTSLLVWSQQFCQMDARYYQINSLIFVEWSGNSNRLQYLTFFIRNHKYI